METHATHTTWAGDQRFFDVIANSAEAHRRVRMDVQAKKFAALETTVGNLTGDVNRILEILTGMPVDVEKKPATKSSKKPKLAGSTPPHGKREGFEPKAKIVCRTVGCKRYMGKPFTENGADWHRYNHSTHNVS